MWHMQGQIKTLCTLEKPGLVSAHRGCKSWSFAVIPACTLCHGQHDMSSMSGPASPLPVSQLSCLALQAVMDKHSFAKANRDQVGSHPHCPLFHTQLRAWEPYKCPLVPVLQSGSSSPPMRWDCWSMAASFLHSILEASSSWVAY